MDEIALVPLDEPARGSPTPLPFARAPRQTWIRAHQIGSLDDQDLAEEVVWQLQQREVPAFFDPGPAPDADLFAVVSDGPPDPAVLDYILSVRMEGRPLWVVVLDAGGGAAPYGSASDERLVRLDEGPELAPQRFGLAVDRLERSMRAELGAPHTRLRGPEARSAELRL